MCAMRFDWSGSAAGAGAQVQAAQAEPSAEEGYYTQEDWRYRSLLALSKGTRPALAQLCHKHGRPLSDGNGSLYGVPDCAECLPIEREIGGLLNEHGMALLHGIPLTPQVVQHIPGRPV